MQWPANTVPSELPDFEKQARRKRFQLLGKACSTWHIRYLCLAHHEDDQAETLLMRLASGHTALGLQGIKPLAEVPECFGIYGVNQSGRGDTTGLKSDAEGSRNKQHPLRFEDGGVKVVRPLLGYTKERLKNTCETAGLSWFEDKTNADPSVTKRNAIRYIYDHHELPKALTKPSLLAMSDKLCKRRELTLSIVEKELVPRYITEFEPASGVMHLRVRRPISLDILNSDNQIQKENYQQAHALFLRAALESVSHKREVSLPTLKSALAMIFPEFIPANEQLREVPPAITLGGVHIQRVYSPTLSPDHIEQSSLSIYSIKQNGNPDINESTWRLARQPLPRASKVFEPEPILLFPPRPRGTEYQEQQVIQHEHSHWDERAGELASDWQLWDGRFWIRAFSRDGRSTIHVRHLRAEDIHSFKNSFERTSPAFRKLRHRLSELSPGEIRFTLPLIVKVDPEGREKILALPSLRLRVPSARSEIEYGIRYKRIHRWFTAHVDYSGALSAVCC